VNLYGRAVRTPGDTASIGEGALDETDDSSDMTRCYYADPSSKSQW
jgi:hypothetical protein